MDPALPLRDRQRTTMPSPSRASSFTTRPSNLLGLGPTPVVVNRVFCSVPAPIAHEDADDDDDFAHDLIAEVAAVGATTKVRSDRKGKGRAREREEGSSNQNSDIAQTRSTSRDVKRHRVSPPPSKPLERPIDGNADADGGDESLSFARFKQRERAATAGAKDTRATTSSIVPLQATVAQEGGTIDDDDDDVTEEEESEQDAESQPAVKVEVGVKREEVPVVDEKHRVEIKGSRIRGDEDGRRQQARRRGLTMKSTPSDTASDAYASDDEQERDDDNDEDEELRRAGLFGETMAMASLRARKKRRKGGGRQRVQRGIQLRKDRPAADPQRNVLFDYFGYTGGDAKPSATPVPDSPGGSSTEDEDAIDMTSSARPLCPTRDGISSDESDPNGDFSFGEPPSGNFRKHAEWTTQRAKRLAVLDARAREESARLGMKPDFPCSALRHRKRAYRLDPNDSSIVIPKAINRFLRHYQRLGVQFMYDRYKGLRYPSLPVIRGGVLGDDMGLGKTIQVIAFLSAIMHKTSTDADLQPHRDRKMRERARESSEGPVDPETFGPTCLIVCPATLRDNWSREIATWGNFRVGVYDGTSQERKETLENYRRARFDIVLAPISKVAMVKDAEALAAVKFTVLIVDEAHTLKNPRADRTNAIKNLQADVRFALTGTLMQNRYREMWSVLDFCAPGMVGTEEQWVEEIDDVITRGNSHAASQAELAYATTRARELVDHIQSKFFLRRTKAEVALELPQKNDQVVFCPMSPLQEQIYIRVTHHPDLQRWMTRESPCPIHHVKMRDCCAKWPEGVEGEDEFDRGVVFRFISSLRKISSHVALVYPHGQDTPEQKELSADLMDQCFPLPGIDDDETRLHLEFRAMNHYQASLSADLSGKWIVLRELLAAWRHEEGADNRVLVFSGSVKLLRMIESLMADTEFSCDFLHGGVPNDERQDKVDNFQRKDGPFCFLISTLAGGVGLNLTAANKVVIFDPSWNPANDLQAMDRAFRMGQKRYVDVYRLISQGTIEENIYERQALKQSAMRIAYEASAEARPVVGDQKTDGELWGLANMFKYHKNGTTLFRANRVALAEGQVEQTFRDEIDRYGGRFQLSELKMVPIETSYGEQGATEVRETDVDGAQVVMDDAKDELQLMEFLGLDNPGMRLEHVKATGATKVERFLREKAIEATLEDLDKAQHTKAYDVRPSQKRARPAAQVADGPRKAPKLELQGDGLVSDSE